MVWASTNSPKHCFIFWLVARDRLPTRDKLHFVISDLSCPICGIHTETQEHLLFACPLAKEVWLRLLRWLHIPIVFYPWNSLVRWTLDNARRKSARTKFIKATFAATIYYLWNARNLKIFEDQLTNALDVVHRITTHVYRLLPPSVDFW